MVCLFTLFSIQTHGVEKWRKRISHLLPFLTPKTHKLEKQLTEMVTSLSNLELAVLDLELRGHTDNINTLDQMAQLAREDIYRRLGKDEQAKLIETFALRPTAQSDSVLSDDNLPQGHRGILQEFLSVNDGNITALVPTPKHLQGLIRANQSIGASITILQKALDKGKSADEFFAIFDTIAWPSPSGKYRDALNQFFTDNAEAVSELNFSPKQVESVDKYVFRRETATILLKAGLTQAKGDAGKFTAFFNAIARPSSPSEEYKDVLNQFFIGNAEAVNELNFSPEQVERIDKYVFRRKTAAILLKAGLTQAKGDAGKFTAFFNAIASDSPSEKYRDILNQFFTDNAEAIGQLNFSLKQVKRIDQYVFRRETAAILLKAGLIQAKGDVNKFIAFFNAIAHPNSPSKKYRNVLNQFFIDNAGDIGKLNFSFVQAERIGRYIDKAETSIVLLRVRERKNREACAARAAALLSLSILPENTESEI